jgi:hypothetical protein
MTFTTLVSKVADRMNLTSASALSRIGDSINEAYKQVASSCGISTIELVPGVPATTTIGNRSLQFGPTPTPVEKILAVYNTTFNPYFILGEISFTEMEMRVPGVDPAQEYAIQITDSNAVTIYLDSVPASAYVLTADVMANLSTLSGNMVPKLPEDFQNCLLYYATAIELDKMEKYDMSARKLTQFENRVADLRYFLATSAWKDIYQGKTNDDTIANVPLVS